jgi:hypothetical protein
MSRFLLITLAHFIIALWIANSWASKRRIGMYWGWFFLTFGTIILGSILINMSPTKNKLKDLKVGVYGFDKWIAALSALACLYCLWTVYALSNKFFWNGDEKIQLILYAIDLAILFGGTAVYFYYRFERHYKMYLDINIPIEVNEPVKLTKVIDEPKQVSNEGFVPEKPSYEIAETEVSGRNNILYWVIAILIIVGLLLLIF